MSYIYLILEGDIYMNITNFIFSTLLVFTTSTSAVKTVESVDLNKYQGQWYEIAAIPQSFQKKCVKWPQSDNYLSY